MRVKDVIELLTLLESESQIVFKEVSREINDSPAPVASHINIDHQSGIASHEKIDNHDTCASKYGNDNQFTIATLNPVEKPKYACTICGQKVERDKLVGYSLADIPEEMKTSMWEGFKAPLVKQAFLVNLCIKCEMQMGNIEDNRALAKET